MGDNDPTQTTDEPDAGRRCRNCGSFITRRFTQVFGDNEGEVYGCLSCKPSTELYEGGAVKEDSPLYGG